MQFKIIKWIVNTNFYKKLKNEFYKIKNEIVTPYKAIGIEKLQIFRRRPFLWPRWCVVIFILCLTNISHKIDLVIYYDLKYVNIFWFLSVIWNAFWAVQFGRIGIQYAYREKEMWQHKARIRFDETELRIWAQDIRIFKFFIDDYPIVRWNDMGRKQKPKYLIGWKPKLKRIKVKRPYWEFYRKRKIIWRLDHQYYILFDKYALHAWRECYAINDFWKKWGIIDFPPRAGMYKTTLPILIQPWNKFGRAQYLYNFKIVVPVGIWHPKNLPVQRYAVEKAPKWLYQWGLLILRDLFRLLKYFFIWLKSTPKYIRRFYWFYIYKWYRTLLNWIQQIYFKK